MDARHRLVVLLMTIVAVDFIRLVAIDLTSVLLNLARLHEVVNRRHDLGKMLLMFIVLI